MAAGAMVCALLTPPAHQPQGDRAEGAREPLKGQGEHPMVDRVSSAGARCETNQNPDFTYAKTMSTKSPYAMASDGS